MPRFDPWNNKRFGFPRKDAPAFQREWKPMNSSGVLVESASRQIVEPPSSTYFSGAGNCHYLWGISYVVDTDAAHAATITDDDGNAILTVVATENGPYFLQLTTPIKIKDNSGIRLAKIAGASNSYVTPFYTTSHLPNENPGTQTLK